MIVPPLALVRLDLEVELVLDQALDVAVDRQADVGAGRAGLDAALAEGDRAGRRRRARSRWRPGVPPRMSSRSASRPARPVWSRPRKPSSADADVALRVEALRAAGERRRRAGTVSRSSCADRRTRGRSRAARSGRRTSSSSRVSSARDGCCAAAGARRLATLLARCGDVVAPGAAVDVEVEDVHARWRAGSRCGRGWRRGLSARLRLSHVLLRAAAT